MQIQIPYKWSPRQYQIPAWDFFVNQGGRYGMFMWHRRAGKDLFCINLICKKLLERPGVYWHIFPSREQAIKAIWEGDTKEGMKYLDFFPPEIIDHVYETQKMIKFKNGSIYRLIGADKDSLVGAGPVGAVFSEYPLMGKSIWDYLEPMISEKEGWACKIFTPRGKNFAVKQFENWKELGIEKGYFTQKLTIEDTKKDTGIDPEEFIRQKQLNGVSKEKIASEYYCDTDAPVEGSYFSDALSVIDKAGQIGDYPWERDIEVNTAWDLGLHDYTAVWFYQNIGGKVYWIDFLMDKDKDLSYYIETVKSKPYVYGRHYAPHDVKKRQDTGAGNTTTRIDIARNLGVKFTRLYKDSIEERIERARGVIYKSYFNEKKCEQGIDCLRAYHRKWDDMLDTYVDHPEHDWASDASDAFCYGAQSIKRVRGSDDPNDPRGTKKRQKRTIQVFDLLR